MSLIRSTFGTMLTPVRAAASLIVNGPPDGWVADQAAPPFWWIGQGVETGSGPIGPNGPHTAPAQAVVTRATSLIVDPLVSDPFKVRRGPDPEPSPAWIVDPQQLRPDGRYTNISAAYPTRLPRSLFWRTWVVHALWLGHGVILMPLSRNGEPQPGARILHPGLVGHDHDGWYVTLGDERVDIADDDGLVTLAGKDFKLVRLLNPHWPDPTNPVGVFAANPNTFKLLGQVDAYTSGVFRSGVPAGFLKVTAPNLTQQQADTLKTAWMKAHGGDRRSIAVLNATTDFTPLSLSPVDTAVAEMRRLVVADVAYAFGMAPEVLGVTLGNSATYSNIQDWWRLHRDFALSPWIDAIGGTLTALVPNLDRTVNVDLDAHARPDVADRYAAYQTGITAGVLTVDEARAKEGMTPLTTPEVSDVDA